MKSELKKLWFTLKDKVQDWKSNDPIMIAPYLSYANNQEAIVRGRVLENEGIVVAEEDGKWENFVNSIKRMESDEIRNARLIVHFQGIDYEGVSDDEGYFSITISIKTPIAPSDELTWEIAKVSLPDYLGEEGEPIFAEAQILMPHANSQYAIITDIDDTILQSHVNSFMKLKLLYETFLKNVHARLAFENIGPVLTRLSKNDAGKTINPIFFLSHSPWNLYAVLEQFIAKNKIPKGPFFLRDLGTKKGEEKRVFKNHKALTIEHLFRFYPEMKFILLGDATEHDVDIYADAYRKYPDRILNIFIRATKKEEKNNHVSEVQTLNPNAPIYLIEHSDEILEIMRR